MVTKFFVITVCTSGVFRYPLIMKKTVNSPDLAGSMCIAHLYVRNDRYIWSYGRTIPYLCTELLAMNEYLVFVYNGLWRRQGNDSRSPRKTVYLTRSVVFCFENRLFFFVLLLYLFCFSPTIPTESTKKKHNVSVE